ncbi:MAG: hypothetical protein KDK28_00030 [Maritimibacter sp.]|nr:hypothetical protein [Maritimibacter sp.]
MTDDLRPLQDLTRILLDAELAKLQQLTEDTQTKQAALDKLGAALALRASQVKQADVADDLAFCTGQDARWQAWTAAAKGQLRREAAESAARREAQRQKAQFAFGRVEALEGIRQLEAEERKLRAARRLHADPDGPGTAG